MLWVKLDAEGALVIQADEPIEAYALRQWEKRRAAGKATLKIETGVRVDLTELTSAIGKDIAAFRAWKKKCEVAALLSEEDAQLVLGKA